MKTKLGFFLPAVFCAAALGGLYWAARTPKLRAYGEAGLRLNYPEGWKLQAASYPPRLRRLTLTRRPSPNQGRPGPFRAESGNP